MSTTPYHGSPNASLGCLLVFFGAFAVLWVGVSGFITFKMIDGYRDQSRTGAWSSVEGVITKSTVMTHHDPDSGNTYSPDIAFRYTVNGQTHTTDTVRFTSGVSTGSRSRAQKQADRYPLGTKVPVYVDPNDPARAVLETGIDGKDALPFLFLSPFWVTGVMILSMIAMLLRLLIVKPALGMLRLVRRPARQREHIELTLHPYWVGMSGVLVASIVSLIVHFVWLDESVSRMSAVATIVGAVVLFIAFYIIQRRRGKVPRRRITLDTGSGTLTCSGKDPDVVNLGDLNTVEITQTTKRNKGSDGGSTSTTYQVQAIRKGAGDDDRPVFVHVFRSPLNAVALKGWLEGHLANYDA